MKKILRTGIGFVILFFFVVYGIGCSKRVVDSTIRIGYFPNINHAQVIIGIADGTFAAYLGPKVQIKTTLFNAGPSVIEAVFSGDIDIAYVGPSPVINGYVRSGGAALKVIAGVASGGSLFVVRPDSGIKKAAESFREEDCNAAAWKYAGYCPAWIHQKLWLEAKRKGWNG